MNDLECPYCGHMQRGHCESDYASEEDSHQYECESCGKEFVFNTTISFYYRSWEADCLNGGEHKFKHNHCYPVFSTKMCCEDCGTRRRPTPQEWIEIEKERKVDLRAEIKDLFQDDEKAENAYKLRMG